MNGSPGSQRNVLVVGFGRMGLTHSTILSGVLGAANVKFTIVDPSLPSRVIARLLFPQATIVGYQKLDSILQGGRTFDLALITTPPNVRDDVVQKLTGHAGRLFLEKPVLRKLAAGQMSGYVLQHAPLNEKLRAILSGRTVRAVRGTLVTNVDFDAVKKGWRATKFGSVLHEFGGHVLSVIGACVPANALFAGAVPVADLVVSRLDRNGVVFRFRQGAIDVEISLLAGASNVRKASYAFAFATDSGDLEYDLYTLRAAGDREIANLASEGVSTSFYVRGFEFTRQMEALIDGRMDVLTTTQIANFEDIVNKVEVIHENNHG